MSTVHIQQLEICRREMFGNLVVTCQNHESFPIPKKPIHKKKIRYESFSSSVISTRNRDEEKRRSSALVDELLFDIYRNSQLSIDYTSTTSGKSQKSSWMDVSDVDRKDSTELETIISCLNMHVERMGSILLRQLKRRDALRRQQDSQCDVITKQLMKHASEGLDMRFTIHPAPGESGFSQWSAAMKMVSQLPGGIPPEFRRRLWLNLAERHLASRGVDWPRVERNCFSEWSHPADAELGVQIVKDLHRTGCSLFCGEDGQENQALLKRVLLAYARWNKAVGYCQGFNMLAALILQVTDKCESEALKIMIYLIEGVLPDSYFADSLRGLSVDMAVFRELLRSRLPRLSKHLDLLQNTAKDGNTSYEPPLTNVFTMQWFLTLFCNCLPQPTVLRVWDLIMLEGNEILLRTALAIWQVLQARILNVRSADEFYCIMGILTGELLENGIVDGNSLVRGIVQIGSLSELKALRDHYLYNINPWGGSLPKAVVDRQLKLYPRERLALDISALKKQYDKLKQRQRQAHIIISAAISRQPAASAPVAMNHLLLGKSALGHTRRLGPPKGSIPPARKAPPSTLHWKDAPKNDDSSSDSSDTELCDEESQSSDPEEETNQICQFNDNPVQNSDTDLMKNDNTEAVKDVSEMLDTSSKQKSESFEDSTNPIIEFDRLKSDIDVAKFKSEESDEENFDFEKFLVDRVRCLKQNSLPDDEDAGKNEEEEKRLKYGRRNSERALQIIQENSLILHRILQCQARMSPSPPLDYNTELKTDSSLGERSSFMLGEDCKESKSDYCIPDLINQTNTIRESLSSDLKEKSPEYGSKYTSILEKSKSLDERYNNLILNSNFNVTKKSGSSSPLNPSPRRSPLLPPTREVEIHSPENENSNEIEYSLGKFSTPVVESPKTVGESSTGTKFDYRNYLTSEKSNVDYSVSESTPASNSLFESSFSQEQKDTFAKFSFRGSGLTESRKLNESEKYLLKQESIDLGNLEERKSPETLKKSNYSEGLFDLEESFNKNPVSVRSEDSEDLQTGESYHDFTNNSKTCYNYTVNQFNPDPVGGLVPNRSPQKKSPPLKSPTKGSPDDKKEFSKVEENFNKSDFHSKLNEEYASSSCKSPTKAFNPFPVPLSSRLNKDVQVKLGLYKK